MEQAHLPIVMAQASEINLVSEGLSKGGLYFITSVLGFLVWTLYQENKALRTAQLESNERHNAEKLAMLKEQMPLVYKLTDALNVVEKVADKLTQE